ncbi:MAG: 16S rRNA (adenine(1518)-N(6)/adenine(1519)-N(6))-dimethyltransferase RsmA [Bacteroidales bacterium]|nr:16S rRNA (adenine(1518)-N(6)/adenine(1519)-N(6))-dimethyltransferase RsmA [Bacteroidales bacterium]MBD5236248.1 16S rRNA (adenine(1518)-N(6)/adenine(1519)-N(6))-dimethyltransferase RsmA [Bacteroidales bacterium]
MQVKAKKQLGQHFLKDEEIARRIAETISKDQLPAEAQKWSDLPILEIGPGMGVLTKYLINSGRQLKAVELDDESVRFLNKVYPSLDVIEGDFLRMDLNEIYEGDFALIGNYPYNISSQIFFKVLDYKDKIPVVAGMLQKEVAERICSGPGSKVYGILSVLLQAWYDCEYLFDVEPEVFHPVPKVKSGVLLLTRNSRTELGCDPVLFKKIIKTSFGMRRKTLRNSLASFLRPGSEASNLEILSQRPERLSVEEFISLTNAIQNQA